MFTWAKRLALTISFMALLVTNILTLTSKAFNTALPGLLGAATGVRTVSSIMQSRIASQNKAIEKHQASNLKRKAAGPPTGARPRPARR